MSTTEENPDFAVNDNEDAEEPRELSSKGDALTEIVDDTAATIPAIDTEETPDPELSVKASPEAVKFLNSVDPFIWRYVSFIDDLVVLIQKPVELEAGLMPVGSFSLTVEPCWYMDKDCYKVQSELKYDMPDFSSTFTLTSWVSPMLRTLQENTKVIYKTRQQLIERKTDFVLACSVIDLMNSSLPYSVTYSSALTNSHAYQLGQFTPEIRKSQITVPPGFLSQGAGLIVDRILTRQICNKSMSLESFGKLNFVVLLPSTDGVDDIMKPPEMGVPLPAFMALLAPPKKQEKRFMFLGNLLYSSLPARQITVPELDNPSVSKTFDLIGFERLLQPCHQNVLPVVTFCYHLTDGHSAVQLQAGCPVQMQISHAPLIVPEDKFLEAPTIAKQDLDWESDAQLRSIFGERTEELKNEYLSFMRHKPELRALLADFLQVVLLRKPDNVFAFAAQYFSSFGSTRPLSSEVLSS